MPALISLIEPEPLETLTIRGWALRLRWGRNASHMRQAPNRASNVTTRSARGKVIDGGRGLLRRVTNASPALKGSERVLIESLQ